MAIYRIFPENDTFLFSEVPTGNAGKDEILEIGGYKDLSGTGRTSRLLVKFNLDEISDTLSTKVTGPYSSSINFYLADAYELPVNYTLYCYPLANPYEPGVGKFGDVPINTTGASWSYRLNGDSTSWITGSFTGTITGSYISSQPGGGAWYYETGSTSLEATQEHTTVSNHDINLDVSNAINLIGSGSLPNNGFLIKLQDDLEFNVSQSIRLKYFSSDTNTIYPPFLEFKWDDTSYETGSLSVLDTSDCVVTLKNNKGEFVDEGKQRFRINSRPTYPTRVFTTSSIYLTNYALPNDALWGLKDEYSEEMIIDFDSNYTKLSCDSSGPFFDIYMNSLQPERYYRLLIKATLDGSTTVIDSDNVFKIVRNG